MAGSTLYQGWGRSTWSDGSWGTPILKVSVDGVEATGAVGSVSVIAEANVTPTGQEATGALGTVSINAEANVPVTGLEATGGVGSVTVKANADVSVTGQEATGGVGDVTVTGIGNVYPTGVSADALTPIGGSAFTAEGDAQLSTAQAKFGSASLLLDGTDDFVTSDDNIDLSSGDFTIDMWIRPTSVTGYKGLWESGTSSTLRAYLIGNLVRLGVGPSTIIFTSTTGVSANVWTMISIEREGNNYRLYINGTLEETGSTANRPDDGPLSIGKNSFSDFNGYIDELRLSSVARYEGTSFTEPSANYAVDGDTTALLHFDGTNGSTDIVNETEGGVTIEADANVPVTAPTQAQGDVGTVTTTADANAPVTGLEVTGGVGSVTVEIVVNVEVTGLEGEADVGDVIVDAAADVLVTGVEATGEVSPVLVWGRIVPNQNPSYTPEQPTQSPGWTDENPTDGPLQTPGWTRTAA